MILHDDAWWFVSQVINHSFLLRYKTWQKLTWWVWWIHESWTRTSTERMFLLKWVVWVGHELDNRRWTGRGMNQTFSMWTFPAKKERKITTSAFFNTCTVTTYIYIWTITLKSMFKTYHSNIRVIAPKPQQWPNPTTVQFLEQETSERKVNIIHKVLWLLWSVFTWGTQFLFLMQVFFFISVHYECS